MDMSAVVVPAGVGGPEPGTTDTASSIAPLPASFEDSAIEPVKPHTVGSASDSPAGFTATDVLLEAEHGVGVGVGVGVGAAKVTGGGGICESPELPPQAAIRTDKVIAVPPRLTMSATRGLAIARSPCFPGLGRSRTRKNGLTIAARAKRKPKSAAFLACLRKYRLMPSSRLRTFGGFAFNVNGVSTPGPATRKARALMAFLMMNRDADTARERLLDIFWSDADPNHARDSLVTALGSIRRCLRTAGIRADEFVLATKSVVRWTAETIVDALQFAELATQDDPAASREALQLYRGDFLEGDYDNWVVAERERLAALYETVLARVVRTSKDPEAAQRFIARNPYSEEPYAVLIEADQAAGRRASAAGWVERCRKALSEVREKPSASFEAKFGNIVHIDPSRHVDVRTNNLPRQRTSFIGRDEELAEIKTLLAKSQVVTLVGTAGVGKTRAALQVGADLRDGFGDGVWFVDLAQVAGADYLIPEIALVFGVQSQGVRPLLDPVLSHLKNKRLLLILDNCEHVVTEASRVVTEIIRDCVRVTVLATSRERLNVQGEHVYRVPSLPVPASHDGLSAEDAMRFSAIVLFVARASAADARFRFDDHKAAIVADICRRLDGIALAIELAAARVTLLSVNQLSQRLDERFRLLTGGDRTSLPRQQTMTAAIDWSYDLLPEDEKQLFRRLSIFQGGWTLEGASAVCSGDSLDESAILEKLSSLVDKSLVAVEFRGESQRYRLLESLRQYGVELLKQHAEFDASVRRHAQFFAKFGRCAAVNWRTISGSAWLAQIEEEIDNIRATLEWSLARRNDSVLGAELVERLWPFWFSRHYQEGRSWLEMAQSAVSAERHPALSVAIGLAMMRMLYLNGSVSEILQTAERTLGQARALGDQHLLTRALYYYGESLCFENRLDEAEPLLKESLELAHRLGDRDRGATRLQALSRLYRRRGMLDLARDYLLRAMPSYDAAPYERNKALALIDLAGVENQEGNVVRAIDLVRQAQRVAQELRDRRLEVIADYNLAFFHVISGQLDDARMHARSALRVSCEERFAVGVQEAMQVIAGVAIQRSDYNNAARLLGYAKAIYPRQMRSQDAFVFIGREWFLNALRDHLSKDQLAEFMAEGAMWSENQAVEEALKV